MATITTVTPFGKRYPARLATFQAFIGTLTGTASYATGGDTLTAKSLGMTEIEGGFVTALGNHVFQVIPNAADGDAKILIFVTSTGVQLGNTVSWATDTPSAMIFGH